MHEVLIMHIFFIFKSYYDETFHFVHESVVEEKEFLYINTYASYIQNIMS